MEITKGLCTLFVYDYIQTISGLLIIRQDKEYKDVQK